MVVGATAYLAAFGAFAAHVSAAQSGQRRTSGPTATGLIAYADDGGIFVRPADGSSPAVMVSGSEPAAAPSWAPDGRRLAYASPDGIWIVNSDGSGRRQLTHSGGLPVWSPRGDRIAWVSGRSDHETSVQVISADGSGSRRIAEIRAGRDDSGYRPSWSPDGRRLLLWSACRALRIVRVSDGEQRILRLNDECDGFDAQWSPDGKTIVFEGGVTSLWTIRPDGSGLRRLARAGHDAWLPKWSPDSRLIAFFSGSRLEVMNADGTGVRSVTRDDGGRFAWSPDSESLAIVRPHGGQCNPSPCGSVLETLSLDGRPLHRLAAGNLDWGEPLAWTR